MLRTVLSSNIFALWPMIALILFALIGLAVILWIFRRDASAKYEAMSLSLWEKAPAQYTNPKDATHSTRRSP